MMILGTLAITGVGIPLTHIGFAGFLSKDAVIESAWAGTAGGYAFWMLVIAALFTSFYSWRLIFMTFFGEPKGDKHTHDHAHESPAVMTIPLGVLAGSAAPGEPPHAALTVQLERSLRALGGKSVSDSTSE